MIVKKEDLVNVDTCPEGLVEFQELTEGKDYTLEEMFQLVLDRDMQEWAVHYSLIHWGDMLDADVSVTWEKLTSDSWVALAKYREDVFKKNVLWDNITEQHTKHLLTAYPEFITTFEDVSFLTAQDWTAIILADKSMIDYCDIKTLTGDNWLELLLKYPDIKRVCDWRTLTGTHWVELLLAYPALAEVCDWDKLDPCNYIVLLTHNEKYLPKVNWDHFEKDHWDDLLVIKPAFKSFRQLHHG